MIDGNGGGPQWSWLFGASTTNVQRIRPAPMIGMGIVLFGLIFFAENAIWTIYHGIGLWVELAVAVMLAPTLAYTGLRWYHGRFDVRDD